MNQGAVVVRSGDRRLRGAVAALLTLPVLLGACEVGREDPTAGWPQTPLWIEVRIAEEAPMEGLQAVLVRGEEEIVYLRPDPIFTSAHVTAGDAFPIPEGLLIELWLSPEGRQALEAATAENLGRRMAVMIDTVAIAAPRIVGPVRADLAVQIATRLPPQEASRLLEAVEATW
jgi:preprotein translocase subunit SecD